MTYCVLRIASYAIISEMTRTHDTFFMEQTVLPMDRRTFLQMLLGVSAATVASSLLGRLPGTLGADGAASFDLLRVFGNMASATAVGRAYLAAYPSQASLEALTDSLVGGLTAVPQWRTFSKTELQAALRAQIRQDFAAERTVKLQGWLVSLTEAQLCGLAALIAHD